MPTLVATDLDGTLLHTDGSVTERTRQVLAALDERGITVVFVTGRPIRWMQSLWHHVGDHGLAVCSNGGIVYDVPGRRVAQARTIPREVGLEVADLVRREVPGTTFAVELATGFGREPQFHSRADSVEGFAPRVGTLAEIFDDSVVKLLARHEELPDTQEASPQDVGPQRHPRLLDEQVPEPARREAGLGGHLLEREGRV